MLKNIQNRFQYFSRQKVTPQDLNQIQIGLLEESTLDVNYLVLILGSCVIATIVFGFVLFTLLVQGLEDVLTDVDEKVL